MGKKVLAFDLNLCTGCRTCEIRCSFKHNQECNPAKSRIRVVKFERVGVSVPLFCLQCEEAFCREACPTQAIQRDTQTGALVHHPERCVGCRACTMACPFSALHVLPEGKVAKCDLCGGDPYCVKYCETGAIRYIDAEDLGEQKAFSVAEKYAQSFLKPRQSVRLNEIVVTKKPAEEKRIEGPKVDNKAKGVKASGNEAEYPDDSID